MPDNNSISVKGRYMRVPLILGLGLLLGAMAWGGKMLWKHDSQLSRSEAIQQRMERRQERMDDKLDRILEKL